MAVRESGATGAAVLEIERFEFTGDGRIELVGTWTGLRARRFIRPTLVLRGEGEPKRLLAVLDHKPWSTDDGGEWVAAFDWKGEPVKFESAELNVGSGIDLHLPAPRMRPGKPRRFKQRVESHDATRELEAAKADAAPAAAGDASPAAPAASPVTPDASPASPDAPAAADAPAPDTARIESLRRELDLVRSARDRAREERDAAFEQVKAARAETEAERQAREQAVAQARAEERDTASTVLAEGADLRAAVERQREMAYSARDAAVAARDEAIEARDLACAERDEAIAARKQAERDRARALVDRDQAIKERERALSARDSALAARDDALEKRDDATRERDTIVSLHERDLPLHEPKPRFAPDTDGPRSDLDVWMPRGVAVGILLLFAFIVLRLFTGA